jgi:DNA polymerase-1
LESENTVYLIDGTAYIYRAYHAIRSLANSRGEPTNAVFGFTRMLIKLMEERSPKYVGMFFDAKGPTFRHERYPAYKANRPPMPADLVSQLPNIKKITTAFNLPIFEQSGYEADDLIGSCARLAEEAGFQVVMVTGDKDFQQLVTPNAIIWDPMKDKVIDHASITAETGLQPHQIIDVMGLSGDSADNVPGVPGIGPKTALTLIRQFGSVARLYEKIDTITKKKQKQNLITYRDQAQLSHELVTIDRQAPIDFDPEAFKARPADQKALAELYKKLEFRQLQRSVPQKSDLEKKRYRGVLSEKELSDLMRRLERTEFFAIDTETTSTNPMLARLVGISIAIEPHEAWYIPVGHRYLGVPEQLGMDRILAALKPILEDSSKYKCGQNIKYDWIVLKRHGIELAGVSFDTMLASYLINPSKRAHNLDQIALDFLDHKTISYADVAGKGKNALTFDQVTLDKAVPYACEDADITLMVQSILSEEIAAIGLKELFEKVEMPLVPVLLEMEMNGIMVDKKRLRDLSKAFQHQLIDLEEKIYNMAEERFNIKSSQQLGHILFEKLKLPVQKKTRKKTGYSTDMDVLSTLSEMHDLPALVLRHRTLAKLKSTYADALLDLINPETERIHTSFNQTVAATGRLSSSDPNLQNIPIRTDEGREIRKTFVPQQGWQLVAADYSQIELRILAHYSEDPILIQAFQKGQDIHTRTAAEVFQRPPDRISSELRYQAKAINFGIIYGMSAFGLSKSLGISQKMAKTYIDNYFDRYSGVRKFIDETIAQARETQRTSTLLGRIRLLPDIKSSNRNVRQFAERIAVNTPIQGTAADLIKLAMIQMAAAIREEGLQAAMLLSVHDEIVFEAPPEEIEILKTHAIRVMEGVWELKAPLRVNVASGSNWAEAH